MKENTNFLKALNDLFRIHGENIPIEYRPVVVYIAGGSAIHYWTRTNVTQDVDCEFGSRILLEDLSLTYMDEAGDERSIYIDKNYNPMFGLAHEDYQEDAVRTEIGGDAFDIRVLSPTDIALSKLVRWAEVDQRDVRALAENDLLNSKELANRANEALDGLIGNQNMVKLNINEAVKIVTDVNMKQLNQNKKLEVGKEPLYGCDGSP